MRILFTIVAAFGLTLGLTHAKETKTAEKTAKTAECAKTACSADKVTFAVAGMTCGGCEGKLSKMFTSVEGVTVDKVCSKSGKACLKYDSEKVSKKDLMAVVKKSGFKLKGEQVTLPVSGMTCGGCSGKVSKALASLEGVSTSAVCHKSNKAVVTFDPSKTCATSVTKAINKTGFKVAKAEPVAVAK